jgi:transposase
MGAFFTSRVFARTRPTDLRKGFNGLSELAMAELGHDLLEGDLFLFVNRRRTSAKVLLWDGTGLCVYAKRLSEGRFAKLWGEGAGLELRLTRAELGLFLEGADFAQKQTK